MAYDDIVQKNIEISERELLDALPHPFAVRHLSPERLKAFIESVRQMLIKQKRLQNE
jgi:hypothetical protein